LIAVAVGNLETRSLARSLDDVALSVGSTPYLGARCASLVGSLRVEIFLSVQSTQIASNVRRK